MLQNESAFSDKINKGEIYLAETVGFIGIGEMGLPMAKNLKEGGYNIVSFGRSQGTKNRIKEAGFELKKSNTEVAEATDGLIFSIVNTEDQMRDVLFGKTGIAQAGRDDLTVVLASTLGPTPVEELTKDAEEQAIKIIDAPVSGGEWGAQEASLTFMASGESEILEKVHPYFEFMGENIFELGDKPGMGQAAKITNNLLLFVNLAALTEGLNYGEKYGIDIDKMREFIRVSTGNSYVNENFENILGWGNDETMTTAKKDLLAAVTAALEIQEELPLTGLTLNRLEEVKIFLQNHQ